MTMPHLSNCPHQDEGWCLDCVGELETMNAHLREQNTDLDAACAKLESELLEQARLVGMGAERELSAMTRIKALERANAELLEACRLFVAYDSSDQTNLMFAYAEAIEAARAAIAKHGGAA